MMTGSDINLGIEIELSKTQNLSFALVFHLELLSIYLRCYYCATMLSNAPITAVHVVLAMVLHNSQRHHHHRCPTQQWYDAICRASQKSSMESWQTWIH